MANKMGNKLVALCTVALGAVYATGYIVTKSPTAQALAVQPETATAPASTSTTEPMVHTSVANNTTSQQTATATAKTAGTTSNTTVTKTAAKTSVAPKPSSSSKTTPSSTQTTTASSTPKTASASTPSSTNVTSGSKNATTSTVKPKPKPAVNTTSKYLDGTYHGAGTDNIGTVYVAVVIQNGKITNVQTQADTHYPQSYIDPVLPQEVLARQSANVDMVSGATDSSSDFSSAVQQALEQAKNPHYAG